MGIYLIPLCVIVAILVIAFLFASLQQVKHKTRYIVLYVIAIIMLFAVIPINEYLTKFTQISSAHVWIFFDQHIPAYKARKLGNTILTEAMKRNRRMTFDSYDRFFPNQDKVPEGGFGNLIALPLQGKARKAGNSVFVDDQFLPFQDQWTYLYNVRKIDEGTVDALLTQHQQEDFGTLATSSENKPWEIPVIQDVTQEDFNGRLIIHKSDRIYSFKIHFR